MASCDVCHVGRPLGRTTGKGRLARRNLWLLACAGASILLLSSPVCALRDRGGTGLRAKQDKPSQATEVTDAVCTGSEEKDFTATLSESKQKVSLQCPGAEVPVVPDLTKGWVCSKDTQDLATCKTPTAADAKGNSNNAVSLSVLMGGTEASPVNWVDITPTEPREAKKYQLSLPSAPLPLLDSKFITGCGPAASREEKKKCKLTVTVEARKSAAAGQTVYCAYGKTSNEAKPAVTMTQQNNTMTLTCGNETTTAVHPTDYTTDYCTDDLVDGQCKKEKFTTLIPGFQSAWWTENKTTRSVTLTIPREHFPDSAKTIHLGCLYTPPETAKAQGAQATNQNLCKVDVVISAKESSASGRTAAALSELTVGAVVLSVSFLVWL